MSELNFIKMEGAGNDFEVFDNRDYGFSLDEIVEFTPGLCDRRFGIGADGILVLESPTVEGVDYTMIYRNADGSDAGMCGNGSRCLALFAEFKGFDTHQTFNVHDAVYKAEVDSENNEVRVYFPDVTAPKKLQIGKKRYLQVHTGTEHVVTFEDPDRLDDEESLVDEGRTIRMHPVLNPPGTNVNFVCLNDDDSIGLQTYERGVEDLTLACGTGAMASAIATHFVEEIPRAKADYDIHVKGGLLNVSFRFNEETNNYTDLILSGPAHFVFQGIVHV